MRALEDWISRNVIRGRHFSVASWTTAGKVYRVTYRRSSGWVCSCYNYRLESQPHRKTFLYECKHIWATKLEHPGLKG